MLPDQFEHGGNPAKIKSELSDVENFLDFSANINPLGMPLEIKYFIQKNIENVDKYPDPESHDFIKSAAKAFNAGTENILPSNGASELFFKLFHTLHHKKAIIPVPSYSDYERAAAVEGKDISFITLSETNNFQLDLSEIEKSLKGDEVVVLGRPNNPTGKNISREPLVELIKRNPGSFFIIDEAFGDFIDFEENDGSIGSVILPNLVTVISLTKMYAIPGLRTGLAIGPADIINQVKKNQSSWPLNYFAQKAGEIALNDTRHAHKTKQYIKTGRDYLARELSEIKGLKVFPSDVNFLLIKVTSGNEEEFFDFLLKHNVIVRRCSNFRGLDKRFFRIGVLKNHENNTLISLVREFFQMPVVESPRKVPALMIVGTGSNVGKSLLCTAFCRIFLNEGYRVMPFKAQNMSLNSCVTREGDEISRAQHLQSLAAKVEPDVKMNPVLLKPVEKSLSQIVLMGKPVGNLGYRDYRSSRDRIWEVVRKSYDDLSKDADIMIIEGAGSPVEMNLKEHDIVNMKMAEYADARVILAGNIDYGGIFASFAGTLMLLNPDEKKRVLGLLVNQFRGDESLFTEGKDLLEEITGKPVLGTIPYAEKHMLPDEDSLSFGNRTGDLNKSVKTKDSTGVKISVIKYPHISNFTDFDPFYGEHDVEIEFLEEPGLSVPDIIILPGSKNVVADMEWIENRGFSEYIKKHVNAGTTEVVGVCGGFQMLGETIFDPHGIETMNAEKKGLGLMEISTELEFDKILKKFTGRHVKSGKIVSGYEIHHGRTKITGDDAEVLTMVFNDNDEAGFEVRDRLVWGTYIHGVFDSDEFRLWFLNRARERKKLPLLNSVVEYNIEKAIEKFSQMVKSRIDLKAIKKSIGLI